MTFITQPKNQLSINQIVLETIQQIRELSKQEWRGGYTERKFENNNWHDIYVPDIRKQVIQSIDFLKILVMPKFDKEMKEEYKTIMEKQEENFKKYAESDIEQYTINKLKLMLELFEKINLFFERKKYFGAHSYEEMPDGMEEPE